MGRFFQAKPIELSQNNIYQPPFELMMAANEYDNNLIKQDVQREEDILNKSVFENREDIDGENFKLINNEYKAKSNIIAQKFQENPESKEAKQMLYELNRKMKVDYQPGGRIDNIRKTYNNDLAYKKKLAESGLSEDVQRRNYEGYLNQFKQNNPNGSVGTYYAPDKIVDSVDFMPDAIKARKEIDPTTTKRIDERLGSLGYFKKHSSEYKVNFEKEFLKDYIESRPELKTSLEQRTASGLYNDFGYQNTKEGKLDFNSEGFIKQANYFDKFNKTDSLISDEISADSTAIALENMRIAKAAAAQVEESRYTDVGKRSVAGTSEEQLANVQKYNDTLDPLRKRLGIPTWSGTDKKSYLLALSYKKIAEDPIKSKLPENSNKVKLYNQAINTRKMTSGQDVANTLNKKIALLKKSNDPVDKKTLKYLQEQKSMFNEHVTQYKGRRIDNNWADMDRVSKNPQVTAAFKTDMVAKASDISFFNRARNVNVLDENNNIINKGKSVNEFMKTSPQFFGSDSSDYSKDKHRDKYFLKGSIGPLINEGGWEYSDIEYEMIGNDGKTYRVQIPMNEIKNDINGDYKIN